MLKVKLWRIENVVVMKILEQGDEIKRGCGTFFEFKGFKLRSIHSPGLNLGVMLVRGSGKNSYYDYGAISCDFKTCAEAKNYIDKATEAIRAYNQSLLSKEKEFKSTNEDIEIVIAE